MKTIIQISLLVLSTLFCTSCATSVGLTATAVTSATISVGAAIIKAPFKIIGAIGDDDEDEDDEQSNEMN